MIAVDTNILVYAHRRDSQWHSAAYACVERVAESAAAWMIPWPCVHEFLAIVTHPRIYKPPTALAAALAQVDAWLKSPSLMLGGESSDHWLTLRKLIESARIAGGAVHDAKVAAICIDHEVAELWTADRDYSRFVGLKMVNPLLAER